MPKDASGDATDPYPFRRDAEGLRYGNSWDVNVEAGGGLKLAGPMSDFYFVNARVGMMWVKEPYVISLGPNITSGMTSGKWGVGGEVQLTHYWYGFWAQYGINSSSERGLVSRAALGVSLIGVEWQHRFERGAPDADALLFKLTLPVGIFVNL